VTTRHSVNSRESCGDSRNIAGHAAAEILVASTRILGVSLLITVSARCAHGRITLASDVGEYALLACLNDYFAGDKRPLCCCLNWGDSESSVDAMATRHMYFCLISLNRKQIRGS